jgi:AcrR family transcriptional regulator
MFQMAVELRSLGTRELILDATVELLSQQGESTIRIADVTDRTGVAISSIYHFYGSREGLVAAAQAERLARSVLELLGLAGELLGSAGTAEEFRVGLGDLHRLLCDPSMAPIRLARVNAIGSTYGRPELAAQISRIGDDLCARLAALLEPAQSRGWMRQDVKLEAVVAWTFGHFLGRTVIELGDEPSPVGADWDRLSLEAAGTVYFGDPTALSTPGPSR